MRKNDAMSNYVGFGDAPSLLLDIYSKVFAVRFVAKWKTSHCQESAP